ncbi:DUF4145 domain-containing protein [Aliivibrio fischeri]|uniref:DUF4145 domain-containing protein n=1 Tax=Aliivibrio fischeri TaxID=668 RepID=A0A6N3YXB9_ALIFS|nr:DUF4145 domain-containing protein [Aliivibrio fischeri]MUK45869.1 DUF4145 domain-containing protein [Aliivibrio fischeri]MUK82924.1 DUF4145 domain-containing protein [Aliivibrio fischeri]MUK86654.1 DUF4145 domain-containing protein [Aliivibrio fischeri]
MNIKKIFCNTCKNETKHELLRKHDRSYSEELDAGWYEDWEYNMWACRGCDTATLETKYICAGSYDHEGNEVYHYSYDPQRKNTFERLPKKFMHIDDKLNGIYKEIILAYKAGLNTVSVMGIRALLEGICIHEGINDKDAYHLTGKLKELEKKSFIPHQIIEGLVSIKSFGDDAAHSLVKLNKMDLELSIELLEALLTSLYEAKFELQHKALQLKSRQESLEKAKELRK